MAQPDDPLLVDVVMHIVYEIEMLHKTAVRLEPPPGGFDESVLTESFLVHARNLHEFLACAQNRNDDVRAFHFTNWGKGFLSQDERKDINKRLSHLSTKRDDDFDWPVVDIHNRAVDVLAEMIESLSDEWRARFGDVMVRCTPIKRSVPSLNNQTMTRTNG